MAEQTRNLAIIPARGGSKRIPRKNIKLFLEKPIIAYSIDVAAKSGLFDTIMVSTDDNEIAGIAKNYGASVPFLRSAETSNDQATTIAVLKEVIMLYAKHDTTFDNICCIYPCAPFITRKALEETFSLLKQGQADTIFPVVRYGHPIQRALKKQGNYVSMIDEQNMTVRTQDLEARYHDAGQFYWLTSDALHMKGSLITDKSIGFEIDENETQDIDNDTDWRLAEMKYTLLHTNNKN